MLNKIHSLKGKKKKKFASKKNNNHVFAKIFFTYLQKLNFNSSVIYYSIY